MNRYAQFLGILVVLVLGLSACDPVPNSVAPADTAMAPTQPAAPTAAVAVNPTSAPAATAAPTTAPTLAVSAFGLTSSAFEPNTVIPDQYTCNGGGKSPALSWTTPPTGTQSLALIMEDPDAVPVAGHVWDHWVIFNIPPSATALPEDVRASGPVPDGTLQGQNSSGGIGYQGPCPPSGQSHGYVFTLYAVDRVLALKAGASKDDVLKALDTHILAQTTLIGKYH